MSGILIIAHAPLASALKACATHTFPDCAASVEALDVPPDQPVEETEAQARVLLARRQRPDAVTITDVFGATPCNVAQRLADGVHVKVVAGANVPMLWRSLCYRHEPIETLAARAVAGAAQGVMQLGDPLPQSQQNPSPAQ